MARKQNPTALAIQSLRDEIKERAKHAARNATPSVQAELNRIDRTNDPIRQTLIRKGVKIRNLQRKIL